MSLGFVISPFALAEEYSIVSRFFETELRCDYVEVVAPGPLSPNSFNTQDYQTFFSVIRNKLEIVKIIDRRTPTRLILIGPFSQEILNEIERMTQFPLELVLLQETSFVSSFRTLRLSIPSTFFVYCKPFSREGDMLASLPTWNQIEYILKIYSLIQQPIIYSVFYLWALFRTPHLKPILDNKIFSVELFYAFSVFYQNSMGIQNIGSSQANDSSLEIPSLKRDLEEGEIECQTKRRRENPALEKMFIIDKSTVISSPILRDKIQIFELYGIASIGGDQLGIPPKEEFWVFDNRVYLPKGLRIVSFSKGFRFDYTDIVYIRDKPALYLNWKRNQLIIPS